MRSQGGGLVGFAVAQSDFPRSDEERERLGQLARVLRYVLLLVERRVAGVLLRAKFQIRSVAKQEATHLIVELDNHAVIVGAAPHGQAEHPLIRLGNGLRSGWCWVLDRRSRMLFFTRDGRREATRHPYPAFTRSLRFSTR